MVIFCDKNSKRAAYSAAINQRNTKSPAKDQLVFIISVIYELQNAINKLPQSSIQTTDDNIFAHTRYSKMFKGQNQSSELKPVQEKYTITAPLGMPQDRWIRESYPDWAAEGSVQIQGIRNPSLRPHALGGNFCV